ncbi:Condensin-2 complex subunit G2 [Bagarius yarrelli]|uniref:Condensin-2 complex subunit G2 n=1 Tax=Bagarius yarrelli TaxID=175774 RepID=A0A556V9D7_BAGYA|nr:Condensin-2 complex subunit G2 [Bagarius yarrelli]
MSVAQSAVCRPIFLVKLFVKSIVCRRLTRQSHIGRAVVTYIPELSVINGHIPVTVGLNYCQDISYLSALSALSQLSCPGSVLRSCQPAIESDNCQSGPISCVCDRVLSVCQTVGEIHLLQRHPEGRSFLTTLEESMNWIEKRVLPFLVAPGDSVSEQQLGLSRRIVAVCLHVCRDAVRVSLGDSDFKDQVLQLCSYVLLSEKGYTCVPVLLSLLSEVAQDCVSCDSEEQEEQMSVSLRIIANIFQKVLEVMAHRLRKDKEEGQEVSDPEEVTTPETVTDLPPLSNCIMSAILKSPAVTRFLYENAVAALNELLMPGI